MHHFTLDFPDLREYFKGGFFQIVFKNGEIAFFQEEVYFTRCAGFCQAESGKGQGGGNRQRRHEKDDGTGGHPGQRRQFLADPLAQGHAAEKEKGDVGPQAGGHLDQPRQRDAQGKMLIEEKKHDGRIAAAAAQARSRGDALAHGDVETARQAVGIGDEAAGAGDEVAFVPGDARVVARKAEAGLADLAELDVVAQVDGLEHGAQGMVAVLALAGDLQAQVDLGERAQDDHSSTSSTLSRGAAE
ncbi:MAG: hypothetical protein MUF02_05870 [Acidobacteria bacterium]|nr:hypothetical protein [Acidobacteriota bacterium]